LFANSFDTLSETGNYLRDTTDKQFYPSPSDKQLPPRKIELANHNDADMGDISPIKLDDGGNHHGSSPPSSYRHPYQERPPPVEFAPAPHYGHQEWRSSYDGYSYPPSNPLFVLRSIHRAFDGCSYKLSCLRDRDVCPVNISQYASIRHYHDEVRKDWIILFFFQMPEISSFIFVQKNGAPDLQDIQTAARRVEAAIHAFGGYIKPKQLRPQSSIFRHRKSPSKEFYEDGFHQRYLVTGNHISWELEDNPPVHIKPFRLAAVESTSSRRSGVAGKCLIGWPGGRTESCIESE
jgi:hypothetical protein